MNGIQFYTDIFLDSVRVFKIVLNTYTLLE